MQILKTGFAEISQQAAVATTDVEDGGVGGEIMGESFGPKTREGLTQTFNAAVEFCLAASVIIRRVSPLQLFFGRGRPKEGGAAAPAGLHLIIRAIFAARAAPIV